MKFYSSRTIKAVVMYLFLISCSPGDCEKLQEVCFKFD